ncbi:hypothetical protein ACRS6B_00660 [Nocardia asteroides]
MAGIAFRETRRDQQALIGDAFQQRPLEAAGAQAVGQGEDRGDREMMHGGGHRERRSAGSDRPDDVHRVERADARAAVGLGDQQRRSPVFAEQVQRRAARAFQIRQRDGRQLIEEAGQVGVAYRVRIFETTHIVYRS